MDVRTTGAVASLQGTSRSGAVYFPGLNGLRALAAMAVVISHITLSLGQFGLDNRILGTDMEGKGRGLDLAGYGVTVFFTLSGFLITLLLLKEKEVGKLNVRNFYVRRILRIWPMYYLYFCVCLLTMALFRIDFQSISIPFYVFLAANIPFILGTTLPFLAHYWSLGVEEQFYLFFPWLARLSNKTLLLSSAFLIFILLSLKVCFWLLSRKYGINLPLQTIEVCRFHTMLIGVIAAIYFHNKWQPFISISTHKFVQIASWLCILLLAINKFHIASVIDGELISLVTVFLIMGQVTRRNNILDLENALFNFLGRISYGIYVIHPLIIFSFSKVIGRFADHSWLNYFSLYVLITSATIFAAYLLYEFYEKRFLLLKGNFSTIKSGVTPTQL